MIEYFLHPTDYPVRSDGFETGIVAPMAGAVAVDATGAAVEVFILYGVLLWLVISHETSVGVGSPPDAHHRRGCKRG